MTYLQDKKRRQKIFFQRLVIFIVIFVVSFGVTKIQKFFTPFANGLFMSSSKITQSTGIFGLTGYITSKNNLVRQNNDLRIQLADLQIKNNELQLVEEENKSLRSILQSSPEENVKILVRTLGDSAVYGTSIIDAGNNKNIKTGDIVLGTHGGMVGKVIDVYANTSQMLSFDKTATSTELLALDSGVYLDAHGDSRGTLTANLPRDTQIEEGEVVVLKSNPKILIGTIAISKGDERDPFKQVLIRMSDQMKYSPYLFVVHQ